MSEQNFNPQLKQWAQIIPSSEAGQGRIEQPGGFDNRVWQTRERPAEPFELALAEALECAFEGGAETFEELLVALQTQKSLDRQGCLWSEQTLLNELTVLGQ
ncbi:recombinase-like helix-turn-helix domain-containing protein [Microbulbifer sp. 2201CG32-9]|uniref:recombinase-like helix-turn-helix domain-containing protein n=1 Tax=Microbulbifer sp. 2201CG32-9 TaxID=3232309 RepID=UPI00345C57FF